jgi:putative endopeptidase
MTLTRLTLTLLLAGALAQQPAGRGFDTSSLDRSCQPCEDFFKFANGGWLSRNPVPAAYSSWGRFHELDERNREQVRQILEDAAKSAGGNGGSEGNEGNGGNGGNKSNEQKIGAYYASCMDAAQVEAAGLKPIEPELRRVEQVRDLEGRQTEIRLALRCRHDLRRTWGERADAGLARKGL